MGKTLEERVLGLIKGQKLVRHGDKVMVAVSGGKDSAVVAWILAKHAKELGIDVALFHISQGIDHYSKPAENAVIELAELLGVPVYIHRWEKEWGTGLPEISKKLRRAPCHICGVLKRYYQNMVPRALGYNVVATGHNLDDSVGFIINNVINGQVEYIRRLAPVLPETPLTVRKIKPLFWIQEWEIRRFAMDNNIPFSTASCPFQKMAPTYKIRRAFDEVEVQRQGTRKAFVKNMLKIVGSSKGVARSAPNRCEICGAPTSGRICAVCKMKMRVGIEPGPVVVDESGWITPKGRPPEI